MNENQYRHAYLIMAHTNFDQLQALIDLLDDARNDIYLHIDKKVQTLPTITAKHSGVFLTDRVNVVWGSYSQIQCEMTLFRAAAEGHYQYYHLISGMDLPLKSQDDIHGFFREHNGKEFIAIDPAAEITKDFRPRTQYYHLLTDYAGNGKSLFRKGLRFLDRTLVSLQKTLHISRKEIVTLYKGANWVSITDAMIHHVLSQEEVIEKQFKLSYCADELFLQSVAMASPLRENITGKYLRAIDWKRGMPYTYRAEDVPGLLASECLWGRKFDRRVDPEAIRAVIEALS